MPPRVTGAPPPLAVVSPTGVMMAWPSSRPVTRVWLDAPSPSIRSTPLVTTAVTLPLGTVRSSSGSGARMTRLPADRERGAELTNDLHIVKVCIRGGLPIVQRPPRESIVTAVRASTRGAGRAGRTGRAGHAHRTAGAYPLPWAGPPLLGALGTFRFLLTELVPLQLILETRGLVSGPADDAGPAPYAESRGPASPPTALPRPEDIPF